MKERLFTTPENVISDLRLRLNDRLAQATAPTSSVSDLYESIVSCIRIVAEDHPCEHVLRRVVNGLSEAMDVMDALQNEVETEKLLREQLQTKTLRDLEAVRDEVDRQREALETARKLLASQGGVVAAIGEWIYTTILHLDALLAEAQEVESAVLRIANDARSQIPDLIQHTLDYETRCAELSAQTAPLLARAFNLSAEDLTSLEEALKSQERLGEECRVVGSLAEEIRVEWERVCARVQTWQNAWRDLREEFKSADHFLPKILDRDLYELTGARKHDVDDKRRLCGERSVSLHRSMVDGMQAVESCMQNVERGVSRVNERAQELETLRDRLTLPGYEEMSEDDRVLLRSLILCFADEKENVPLSKLIGVVAMTSAEQPSVQERVGELAAASTLLVVRGNVRFRLYGLTERGMYWHARWRSEDAERIAIMAEARTRYDADVVAREAAEEADRARRAEERKRGVAERREHRQQIVAQQEAEKNDPFRIRDRMNEDVARMFCVLGQWPALPAIRDAIAWAKLVTAAEEAGLMLARDAKKVAKDLVRLINFQPALLVASRNEQNVLVTNITPVGESVCRIMAAPVDQQLQQWDAVWRGWDASDRILEMKTRRQELFTALTAAMATIAKT